MKHVSLFCDQGSAAIKDVLMGQLHLQRQQWFQDWQAVKIDTRVMVSTQRLLASNERFVKHIMNMSNLEDFHFWKKSIIMSIHSVSDVTKKITGDFFFDFAASLVPWSHGGSQGFPVAFSPSGAQQWFQWFPCPGAMEAFNSGQETAWIVAESASTCICRWGTFNTSK